MAIIFCGCAAGPGKTLIVYRVIDVRAEIAGYELRFRVRYTDLKPGKESWHDGRIIVDFKDSAGNKLKPGPQHPNFRGSSKGWETRSIEFAAPQGATKLEIMPALFAVAGGQLDLDDIVLVPITDAKKIAAMKRAVLPWATEAVTGNVQAPAPEKMPKSLRVVGNQLQTADGNAVWLQGLAIPSLEWSAKGENILKSVEVAIDQWKANVIRLPVKETYWFGWEGQKDEGESYRKTISDAVNLTAGAGPTWSSTCTNSVRRPPIMRDSGRTSPGITGTIRPSSSSCSTSLTISRGRSGATAGA